MAFSNVTLRKKHQAIADEWETRGTVSLGNPYTAGGEPYTAARFGLSRLDQFDIQGTASIGGVRYAIIPDRVNSKVQAFVMTTGLEAGAIDLSTVPLTFVARGRG